MKLVISAKLTALILFIGMVFPIMAQQLLWSTVTGGSGIESFPDISLSKKGSLFIAYTTSSVDSIVTVDAAFPQKKTPFSAGVLAKLNADKKVAWATYFTGDSLSNFNVVKVLSDQQDGVYLLGTSQGTGFPISNDGNWGVLKGRAETCIAKFDTNGIFLWAKCLSSNGFDLLYNAQIDNAGDIWFAGSIEYSTSVPFVGLPITANAYQALPNLNNVPNAPDEMFLACISKDGALLYCSYFGGDGFEEPRDISIDSKNTVYFLVATSSNNIDIKNNPFELGKRNDNFYAISINKADFKLNFVAPLPIEANDVITSLKIDNNSKMHFLLRTDDITKYTLNKNSILLGGKAGVLLQSYSTSFKLEDTWALSGFARNEVFPLELETNDSSLMVLLSDNKNKLQTNPFSFQRLNNGLIDAFILSINYDFTIKWATFLGKSNNDFPRAIKQQGETIWVTGNTYSEDFYLSNNAIKRNFNNGQNNGSNEVFLSAFNCASRQIMINKSDDKLCFGNLVTLSVSQPFAFYNWNNAINSDTFSISSDSMISLQVIDSFGCIYFLKEKVAFLQPPIAISYDTTFCNKRNVVLTYLPNDNTTNIIWNTGSRSNSIQVNNAGKYKALVFNPCFTDSFEINVAEIDCNGKYFVPNAFTPNGDEVNDLFEIKGINIQSRTMQIYNRWGELIFTANPGEMGWNGFFGNKPVQSDIYIYVLQITDTLGEQSYLKGTVQVLK